MTNSKPLVLIVDDEAENRDLLEKSLSSTYRVLLAHNGQRAKNLYMQFGRRVGVVVTDAEMPIVDGVALTSWLLGQPQPPRIILMGGSDAQTTAAARELWQSTVGITWLDKPLSLDQLKNLLDATT